MKIATFAVYLNYTLNLSSKKVNKLVRGMKAIKYKGNKTFYRHQREIKPRINNNHSMHLRDVYIYNQMIEFLGKEKFWLQFLPTPLSTSRQIFTSLVIFLWRTSLKKNKQKLKNPQLIFIIFCHFLGFPLK